VQSEVIADGVFLVCWEALLIGTDLRIG